MTFQSQYFSDFSKSLREIAEHINLKLDKHQEECFTIQHIEKADPGFQSALQALDIFNRLEETKDKITTGR